MTTASGKGWIFLVGAIIFEILAALSMKGALQAPALFLVVASGYVASFACLAKVLKSGMPIGVAYGIWGAVGVIATAVLSALLFGEQLTAMMGAGIALTIAGVFFIRFGSIAAAKNKETEA